MDSNPSSPSDEPGHLCTSCSEHPGGILSCGTALRCPQVEFRRQPLQSPHRFRAPTPESGRGPEPASRHPSSTRGAWGPLTTPGTERGHRPPLRRLLPSRLPPRLRPASPPRSPHSSRGLTRQSSCRNGAASGDGAGLRGARTHPSPRPLSAPRCRVTPGQWPDLVLRLTRPGTGLWAEGEQSSAILTAESQDPAVAKALGKDGQVALTPGSPTLLGPSAQSLRIGAWDIARPETRYWVERPAWGGTRQRAEAARKRLCGPPSRSLVLGQGPCRGVFNRPSGFTVILGIRPLALHCSFS